MASAPALDLRWTAGPGGSALCELLHASLDDFAPLAIHEHETPDGWRVFFRTTLERDRAADAMRASFADSLIHVLAADVPDEGWARRSQAGLTAVRIGSIVVAPPWDAAGIHPGAAIIVIEPSTGFGTGHHETTRLCLSILQTLDLTGRRVIDVGTGSGVLAVAASKLGASSVVAVDNDPDALDNARENIARNGCGSTVHARQCDLAALSEEPADVVTANLTAAVLERHARGLIGLVRSGGTLLVSGFGPDELPSVTDAFHGLRVRRQAQEGAWLAVAMGLSG